MNDFRKPFDIKYLPKKMEPHLKIKKDQKFMFFDLIDLKYLLIFYSEFLFVFLNEVNGVKT